MRALAAMLLPVSLEELARLRKEAAAEIDRLIGFLDASDTYVQTEFEEACEDEGAGSDDEFSLGFLERHPSISGHGRDRSGSQERLSSGSGDDLESEHDGREPNHDEEEDRTDYEPDLGWTIDGCTIGVDPEAVKRTR